MDASRAGDAAHVQPAGSGPAAGTGGIEAAWLDRLAATVTLADADRRPLPVRAPFTGEQLGAVPACSAADVHEAVRRARLAQPDWAGRPPRDRARLALRLHDVVLDRQARVLDLIQLETGKARKDAYEEVADVALVARYYGLRGERHMRPRRRRGAFPVVTRAWELYEPCGVAAVIAPWNYPLTLALSDGLTALVAGNAVVLKPDPRASFTALLALELLREAGLPADLLHVVTGDGAELGPPLVAAADVVTFTGSTETGRKVARVAAERFTPCTLELGGKNPLLVLADADLDAAVAGAVRGAFANAGQLCIGCERILVDTALYDEFVRRFADATAGQRLGTALDYSADMGSLIDGQRLAHVEAHVADAIEKGARVLAGGRPRPEIGPFFHEPTVLAGVTPGMRVYAEETFGPVASVFRFDSVDDAIALANATPYGLSASIWTRRPRVARRLAARIKAGAVNVNEAYGAVWGSTDAAMGGLGDSGIGSRHGRAGILSYTRTRTVAVQRLHPLGAPPGGGHAAFVRRVDRLLRLLRRVPGLR